MSVSIIIVNFWRISYELLLYGDYFAYAFSDPVHLEDFAQVVFVFFAEFLYDVWVVPNPDLKLIILTKCWIRMFELRHTAGRLIFLPIAFFLHHLLLFPIILPIHHKHPPHFGINIFLFLFVDFIQPILFIKITYTLFEYIFKVILLDF